MIKLINTSLVFCMALAVLSCSGKKSKEQESTPAVAQATTQAVEEVVPEAPLAEPVTEEQLFTLLMDWKEAQNSGEYHTYSSFYGREFQGIKRSGENTSVYARERWLKDRKRMFRKPMTVTTSEVKIFMDETPYRIHFNQGWSNGSYSDFGPKELLVSEVEGGLEIVKEEMLQSTLVSAMKDVNNAFNNELFFNREGNYVYIPIEFSQPEFYKKEERCHESWGLKHCVDVSYYKIDSLHTQTPLDSLIDRKIYIGSIDSEEVESYTVEGWRATSKKLNDSLPGITHRGSRIDPTYHWVGGHQLETPKASALYFESDEELPIASGQWALISSRKPEVFKKKETDKEEVKKLFSQLNDKDYEYYSLTYFEGMTHSFVVTYNEVDECGYVYYEDVRLWELKDGTLLPVKELPDLPVAILDVDGDENLDLLYSSNFKNDPAVDVWWESSNYGVVDGDTVFLSCGC